MFDTGKKNGKSLTVGQLRKRKNGITFKYQLKFCPEKEANSGYSEYYSDPNNRR
jgi:hypothetical protein